MAKNLGIKITVDMTQANSELEAFERKWKNLGKEPLDLKVNVDTKKVTRLANSIKSVFGADNERDLKINLDIDGAMKNLNRFKEEFSKVKQEFEGMGFKQKKPSFDLSDVKNDGKIYGFGDFDKIAQQFNELSSQSKDISVNLTRGMDGAYRTVTNITSKIDDAKTATLKMVDGITTNVGLSNKESANIKDYLNMYKEYMSLQQKAVGTNNGALNSQINKLKSAMNDFKNEYKASFGKDIESLDAFKRLKEQSEFKLKFSIEQQSKKNLDNFIKEVHNLEKERIKLEFKIENASDKVKPMLEEQITGLFVKQQKAMSKYNVRSLSEEQQQALDLMLKELSTQERIKQSAQEEKAVMSSLVSSQRDLLKIKKQIAELDVHKEKGTIKSNEEYKLQALRDELKIKQDIYNAELKSNKSKLSQSNYSQLKNLEKAQNEAMDLAQAQAKANSKVRESQELYSELFASIKKIASLSKNMIRSGDEQADGIQELINKEKEYQNVLRNTIKTKNLVNDASEKQYQKEVAKAQREVDEARVLQHKNENDKRRWSGLAGQILNPRAMHQDAKQAFQTIYDSVAKVDEQFVNIAKVADAPQSELNKFGDEIFDQASKVGKAADEYGVSVARWLTTGKSLKQAIDLSQTSVMGSFVGNIDEESMVKYMAVPLENYKSSALQATDIINAMNEVANKNAVEMNDLGEAYARASQTASSAGTTFAQLTGLIAGANTTTRAGGEKIGTALKAIDLNISNIGAQLTKGSGEKFTWLADHGIALKDANGQLRTTYDVLTDLQKVWNNLSANDKGTATFYLAGKHHAPILQGIVKGWSTVQKATKEAEGQLNLIDKESGSAFQEFSKQQNSVQYATAQLSNDWAKFLHEIAGGKEGIVDILKQLQKVLEVGTKLAQNEGVMKFAKTIAILAGETAGVIALQRGLNGVFDVVRDAKNSVGMIGSLAGLGKKHGGGSLGGNRKISVASDASYKTYKIAQGAETITSGISAMGGTTGKVGKLSGAFGKLGKVVGVVRTAIGGLVPVIGTVIGVMTILDAMGIPVFEKLGEGIKSLSNEFKSATQKAKEANDDFVKEQKKLAKKLDKNKLLNGEIDQANSIIETYESIKKAKEKAFSETGDRNQLGYTKEEFLQIKKLFNRTAEDLGFDIRITMNDFSDIEEKFKTLIALKNQLTKDELDKVNKTFNQLTKPKSLKKDKKAFEEEHSGADKDYEKETINLQRQLGAYKQMQRDKTSTKEQKNAQLEAIKEQIKLVKELAGSYNELKNSFYASEEARKANKADAQRFSTAKQERDNFAKQARNGVVDSSFDKISVEEQYNDMSMLVSKYNDDKKTIDRITKAKQDLERAKKSLEKGEKGNAIISEESLRTLSELDSSFKNLGRDVAMYGDNYGTVMDAINSKATRTGEENEGLKKKMLDLAKIAGWSDEQLNTMVSKMNSTGAEFAKYMLDTFGDAGALMLNISATFQDMFGNQWKEKFIEIQKDIDGLTDNQKELLIKYKLVNADGTLNTTDYMKVFGLPNELLTKYNIVGEDGKSLNFDNLSTMFNDLQNNIPEELKTKFTVDGLIDLDKLLENWDKLKPEDKKKIEASLGIKVSGNEALKEAEELLDGADKKNTKSTHTFYTKGGHDLEVGINEQNSQNNKETSSNHTFKGDNSDFKQKKDDTESGRKQVNGTHATVNFKGDASNYNSVKAEVKKSTSNPIVQVVQFVAEKIGDWFSGGSSKKKGGKSHSSVSIDNGNISQSLTTPNTMSRSFSASIGQAVSNSLPANANRSFTKSTDSKDDTRVNEDVWRYWGKELYKGLPLDRSYSDLEDSIKQMEESIDKLIPLYKQQIALIDKQIAYQKELKSAKQSELNDVLGKLRSNGFRTSGNQITNLDLAKSFKGEKASEVETLLSKWKELYEGLDSITGKINDLNMSKFDINKQIKDTDTKMESEKLEKRLKNTDKLLKSISNHADIIDKLNSFVSDSDTVLKSNTLSNSSKQVSENISRLIKEFNELSKTTTKYAENGENVADKLESLKSEILSNTDSLIEYQEQIRNIKIDKTIDDLSRYTETINANSDAIENNIKNLKDGLLSGTELGDLLSTDLGNIDYFEMSDLEKQYKERIELEKQLNREIEKYNNKNVDLVKGSANDAKNIEFDKFETLKNYQKQSYKDMSLAHVQNLNALEKGLIGLNIKYINSMNELKSKSKTDLTSQELILEQLKLQEELKRDSINVYKEAISNAEKELNTTTLTTEQHEKLVSAIKDYKEHAINAQNEIKDIVKSRFDLEFELLDKEQDEIKRMDDRMKHLSDVAEVIGMNQTSKQVLLEKSLLSKIMIYANAKSQLEKLLSEQSKYDKDSFEWKTLEDKIKVLSSDVDQATIDILNANKEAFTNQINGLNETIQKSLLNGETIDKWRDHTEQWIGGIEKELELEEIRKRLINNENAVITRRLEALDLQKEVSKSELDYLDKQTKVLELQNKLANIGDERNIQTIKQDENGKWNWEYIADQSEYDKTLEELNNARKDLESYKNEQRLKYAQDVQSIINDVKDGKFESPQEIMDAFDNINKVYASILTDIPEIKGLDINGIMDAYAKYMKRNDTIISETTTGGNTDNLLEIGKTFETAFVNVSTDVAGIIENAIKNAMSGAVSNEKTENYIIQKQELSFPNVTDTTGFEQVLLDLPKTAKQKMLSK